MSEVGLEAILFLVLLFLSGFFSGSEVSLLRLRAELLEERARRGDRTARAALWLLRRPQEMLSTILVGNNVVNLALASLATVLLAQVIGLGRGAVVATLVTTVLVVLFGEVIPKTFAVLYPNRFANLTALPIRLLATLLWPVNRLIDLVVSPLVSLLGVREESGISREELAVLVRQSARRGKLPQPISSILTRTLSAHELTVKDVMTPRTETVMLSDQVTIREALETHLASGFSRIPITSGSRDEIRGISFLKDLVKEMLEGRGERPVGEVCRPALFLPEMLSLTDALAKMQRAHQHLAVVVDEFGGVEGVVSLEDILEELVGELTDEHDFGEAGGDLLRRLPEGRLLVRGRMRLDELARLTGRPLRVDEVTTVGGLIMDRLGGPAKVGDQVRVDGLSLEVVKTSGNTIQRVIVTPAEETGEAARG